MKARHFVLLILLLLAGGVGGWLVLPSASEVGLMRLKDKQFGSARTIYERRITAGDYSVDAVMPLVEIYMQYGETDRAIQLLDKFTQVTQRSADLMDAMGRVKRSAQKPLEYMRAMEGSVRLKHDPSALRHLASLYRYYDHREGLAHVLDRLAASGKATNTELFELAQTRAATGLPQPAIDALRKLEASVSGNLDDDSVELWVRLLLDVGKADEAFSRAKEYLARHKDPHAARTYAAVFAAAGRPQTGYAVLQLLPQFLGEPDYLKEWIEYELRLGMRTAAWQRLQERYRAGRLPVEVLTPYVELAMEYKQAEDAWQASLSNSFTGLPAWLIANMAELFFEGKQEDRLRLLTQAAGTEFFTERPLLGARVLLGRNDIPNARRYLQLASRASDHTERLAAAELYAEVGSYEDARRALGATDLRKVHSSALSGIADVYTRLKSAAEGAARLQQSGANKPTHRLFIPWALLMLTAGRDQQVATVLETIPPRQLSASLWRDVFYVAQDHRCLQSAITAAQRLLFVAPSDESGHLLGHSLIAAGRFTEALPVLRTLQTKSAEAHEGYISALIGAVGAKPHDAPPELQAELAEQWTVTLRDEDKQREAVYGLLALNRDEQVLPYIERWATEDAQYISLFLETATRINQKERASEFVRTQLDRFSPSHAKYEELVWWLIDARGKSEAEPYIMRLAEGVAETWIEAAADLLIGSKRLERARFFLLETSKRAGLSESARTRIAYQLLELGAKSEAAQLLFDVVRTAKPDDARVRDFVQLIQSSPANEHLDWLSERARSSRSPERHAWFRHLAELNAHDRVLSLVEDAGDELDAVLQLALHSAVARKANREADRFAAVLLTRSLQPETLRSVAQTVSQPALDHLADSAWRKLLRLVDGDGEALRWLAQRAMADGRTAEALAHSEKLTRLRRHDASSALAHAELLRERGAAGRAQQLYQEALRKARAGAPSIDTAGIEAYVLFRLGDEQQAFATYERLRSHGSLGAEMRADYAALLVEAGASAQALSLLQQRPTADQWHLRSRMLEAEILAAQLKGREALAHVQRTIEQSGGDPQALHVAASVEERLGRTLSALAYIQEAVRKAPDNRSIRSAWSDIRLLHGSTLRIDTEQRNISGLQEQFWTTLASTFRISDSVAGILRMNTIRFSDEGEDSASTRRFVDLGVEWRGTDGWTLQAMFTGSDGSQGLAGSVVRADERGRTEVRAEWSKPLVEIAELLSAGGVRDALEVEQSYRLTPGTLLRGIAGLRQYRPSSGFSSSATWGFTGVLQQQITRGGLLNAEYVLDSERLRSWHGVPLISSREVHSGALNIQRRFRRHTELHAAAGIAADRLGSHGPFWSIDAGYMPRRGLRFELFFERRRYKQAIDRDATRGGGALTWRF